MPLAAQNSNPALPAKMPCLRRFLGLKTADRWLLLQSGLVVVVARLCVKYVPFRMLRRLAAGSREQRAVPAAVRATSLRIGWAVGVTATRVPGATCLTQALAVQVLLRMRRIPGQLHIGVARDRENQFVAHAWVESGDQIVIGGDQSPDQFTHLMVMEPGTG